MPIEDLKFQSTDFAGKDISSLPDRPSESGMTAAELKARFDYIPKMMIGLGNFNKLIDALKAETSGDSGADNIGAPNISDIDGTTVGAQLQSIKNRVDTLNAATQNFAAEQAAASKKYVDSVVLKAGAVESVNGKAGAVELTAVDVGAKSNENLLDNWHFADPINQRGQTSYDTHKLSAYGIDRWWSIFTSATIQQDGILIKTNADAAYAGVFRQAIGEAKQLAGKTVTLSLLLKEVSGTVTLGLARANGLNTGIVVELPGVNTSSAGLLSVTGTLSQNVGSSETPILLASLSCSQGGTYKIVAAKLELGDKQTLVHKDADGNWVLNDPPPNKALELVKCQRYQSVIDYGVGMTLSVAVSDSGGNVFFPFYLPASLRANGVVSSTTTLRVHGDGTSCQNVTFDGTARVQGNITSILVKGLDPLTIYSLDSASAGKLIFDFNL